VSSTKAGKGTRGLIKLLSIPTTVKVRKEAWRAEKVFQVFLDKVSWKYFSAYIIFIPNYKQY
jgi:hypothetical protein